MAVRRRFDPSSRVAAAQYYDYRRWWSGVRIIILTAICVHGIILIVCNESNVCRFYRYSSTQYSLIPYVLVDTTTWVLDFSRVTRGPSPQILIILCKGASSLLRFEFQLRCWHTTPRILRTLCFCSSILSSTARRLEVLSWLPATLITLVSTITRCDNQNHFHACYNSRHVF